MYASSRVGSTSALVLAAGFRDAIVALAMASLIGTPVVIDAPTLREVGS